MEAPTTPRPHPSNLGFTAAVCGVFVAAMVGMSFAAVPLYRMFCAATGYGGTPRVAERAPDEVLDRVVTVRFDANIGNGLGWSFRPAVREMKMKLGEMGTVAFIAENRTDTASAGTAAFNVAPDDFGPYFNKIACFCFTEQTLAAGEKAELVVTFFVDPALARDPDLATTNTLTLSYTFYPAQPKAPKPVAAAPAAQGNRL